MSNTAAKLPHPDLTPTLKVAISLPLYRLFDYLPPAGVDVTGLQPGLRLEVPFQNGKKIAYLVEVAAASPVDPAKLKPALRILDEQPLLGKGDLQLLHWASRYYHHPLGEVFAAAFPASLRQGKAVRHTPNIKAYMLSESGLTIEPDTLTKSPKQMLMLEKFRQCYPESLSIRDLQNSDNNWRATVKNLSAKGLLTLCPIPMEKAGADPAKLACKISQADIPSPENIALNYQQQAAVTAVSATLDQFAVFLLDGITGSGKTEVYLQLIREVLARGRQVLVLTPEINLTPQLQQRFNQRFPGNISLYHSGLTGAQRQTTWDSMRQGHCPILLGTRSALFTPMAALGLIILDEEHDPSFKQQEGFRFSARDTAVMRAKIHGIPVLLGSATPSLESLYNADKGRYQLLSLTERAGNASPPAFRLLDIRNKKLHSGISEALLAEIKTVLVQKGQALLFLNRRGYAPTLICHGCGWVARCRSCDANLVIHNNDRRLRCHHCGKEQALPPVCPACTSKELIPSGLGTERIEQTLQALLPDARLVRLDRDTTRYKGKLEHYLEEINRGEADLILGTQMLAKGHHFPKVTLVAIVDSDSGLFGIDYRASERLAQLIVQVAGRAGRADQPGLVILQTRHPDHPLLTTLIRDGYRHFAKTLLTERQAANLPPYSYQAVLRAHANKPEPVRTFLQEITEKLNASKPPLTQILGPVAAPMEKRAGVYRYQVLFQSGKRSDLQTLLDELTDLLDNLKSAKKVRWSLDVDPVDLC